MNEIQAVKIRKHRKTMFFFIQISKKIMIFEKTWFFPKMKRIEKLVF